MLRATMSPSTGQPNRQIPMAQSSCARMRAGGQAGSIEGTQAGDQLASSWQAGGTVARPADRGTANLLSGKLGSKPDEPHCGCHRLARQLTGITGTQAGKQPRRPQAENAPYLGHGKAQSRSLTWEA